MQVRVSVRVAVGEIARVVRVGEAASPRQRVKVPVGPFGPVFPANLYVVPVIFYVFPDPAPTDASVEGKEQRKVLSR